MMVLAGWLVDCCVFVALATGLLNGGTTAARQDSRPSEIPTASMIEWTGRETFAEALKLLNQTGNVVVDGRAARNQTVVERSLKLSAGRKAFWAALDELCAQAQLEPVCVAERIELIAAEGKRSSWIAYDGPWRGRIVRRMSVAGDDPALDRLICQVQVTIEPRLAPLLLTFRSSAGQLQGTYNFEGQLAKAIDMQQPLPSRATAQLDQLVLEGEAWVAPGRLNLSVEAKKDAQVTQDKTTFTIRSIQVDQGSKVWELNTELHYPEGSLEWESHQSRLLSSAKLTLVKGQETHYDAGREIRTDAGRRVTLIWFFRNVPGAVGDFQAKLQAPAAPVRMPMKLVFTNVALP